MSLNRDWQCILTPNRPLIHTCFTYPKLNMDNFSALYGAFVYVEGTK